MADAGLMMKISFFIIIVLVIQGLMFGDTIWDESFDRPSYEEEPGTWNLWTTFKKIADSLWSFMVFSFRMLTFDIPEIPWILRIILLVPIWAGIIYITAPLLIALAHAIAELIPL